MPKWKVYISSTFKDLKDFRSLVINLFQKQLENNFELTRIMEWMYDEGGLTPFVNDCKKSVKNCDIYIIILGNKVGSSPPKEKRTYTEIEMDTAIEEEKDIFCLRLATFDENEIENKAKHTEILNKFAGKPVHVFTDLKELENCIYTCLFPFASLTPVNKKNPYKGLAAFDVEDGNYFFGRNGETRDCLKKIITNRKDGFISIVGNSGIGKTSFARAGILFQLKTNTALGFSDYKQVTVTPGSEPFSNLIFQLHLSGIAIETLLNKDVSSKVILFFNQFEEVISQCHTEESIKQRIRLFDFLDNLSNAKNSTSELIIITTFRSDFISQLANFDFIKNRQIFFPLSSLDYRVNTNNWESSIREIIKQPAINNGVEIEKELVAQLINEIKEVDGSLPILQFTLEKIWNNESIKDRIITSTEYNNLSQGKGISGIIESHAEEVVKRITEGGNNNKKEAVLKSIFVNLVEVNENLLDVKKRVEKEELFKKLEAHPADIVRDVFEDLISNGSRLLVMTETKDKSVNIDLIHEVLIRRWERLRVWINQRRAALEYQKKITNDAESFKRWRRGFYEVGKLQEAKEWHKENPDLTNHLIAEFIKQSEYSELRKEDLQYKERIFQHSVDFKTKVGKLYSGTDLKQAKKWQKNNPDLTNDEINGFIINSTKKVQKRNFLMIGVIMVTMLLLFERISSYKRNTFIDKISDRSILGYQMQRAGRNIDSIKDIEITYDKFVVLRDGIDYFKNLETLSITGTSSKDLTFAKGLTSIHSLVVTSNDSLKSLDGIQSLKRLDSLEISGNTSLKSLKEIQNLPNLRYLVISNNDSLMNLKGIQNLLNLNSLKIISNDSLKNFKGLQNLPNLHSLTIDANNGLTSLDGIQILSGLESLVISGHVSFDSLKEIHSLRNLDSLVISSSNLTSLEGIQNLPHLRSLVVYGNHRLPSLKGIRDLPHLDSLAISDNYALKSLEGLQDFPNLHFLSIDGNEALDSLEGVQNLPRLNSLKISGNGSLKSLKVGQSLPSVYSLEIYNSGLTSLEGLQDFPNLCFLKIDGNLDFKNLKGTRTLLCVDSLEITGNTNLTSLAGIQNFPNLRYLNIDVVTDRLDSLQIIKGLSKIRVFTINAYYIKLVDRMINLLYYLSNLEQLRIPEKWKIDYKKLKIRNPYVTVNGRKL
jgi:Leucine-rich repeat (LRR) protein